MPRLGVRAGAASHLQALCRVIQIKRQVQIFLGNFLHGVAESELWGSEWANPGICLTNGN